MRSFLITVLMAAACAVPAVSAAQPPRPASEDAAYYFLLGRHLEGLGRIDEAVAAHRRAMELEPRSAELVAELAGLYARQDKALEALETAEAALALDPDNLEGNRILGSVYAALAEQRQRLRPKDDPAQYPARAITALEKTRRENVFDVSLELMLGRLYLQTGAFDKALPALQRVVDDQPEYAEAAFLLATAQEGAGQPAAAIATLEQLLGVNPAFYRGHVRLAETYEREQRWKDAAAAYARAQALNPRAGALTSRRAAALLNGGDAEEARGLVEKAVAAAGTDAPDPMLLYLLAEAQRATRQLDSAEATARRLLASAPDDVRGLHVMALILQDKGDTAGAERSLRSLIALDPMDANALNSLGYMLAERGERLDEAVELLQRALKIEPDNPAYLDSLGWAFFRQGRIDLADPPLTKAAASLADSSVVQDHLGDLRFKQQRWADAVAAWERALAGDGQSIDRVAIEKKLRDARGRLEPRRP